MSIVQYTDLRSITRDSNRCQTLVGLDFNGDRKVWLVFGQCQIQQRDEPGQHYLEGRMLEGATDFDHDSPYAIRLPLVGLTYKNTNGHQTSFTAWVDPNNDYDFHVPRADYDPTKHKNAHKCKQCKEAHIIVPEGFYVPPFDPELYEAVRGKKLTISIGPTYNGLAVFDHLDEALAKLTALQNLCLKAAEQIEKDRAQCIEPCLALSCKERADLVRALRAEAPEKP